MAQVIKADEVHLSILTGPAGQSGRKLTTWNGYRFTEDMFTPANSFEFSLALTGGGQDQPPESYVEAVCMLTQPDSVVQLEMGGLLLGTGIIEEQYVGEDDAGIESIVISGLDPATVLLNNEVDPHLQISGDTTLPQVAEQILKPYRGKGISFGIVADDQANRSILSGKKIQSRKTVSTSKGTASLKLSGSAPPNFNKATLAEVRPHPGETEWDFLERHAENIGVLMYFTAQGDLAFIYPDYEQEEIFQLLRRRGPSNDGNIQSGGQTRSHNGTATSVHVLGRGSLYHREDPTTKHRTRTKKVKPKIQATAKTDRKFLWRRDRYLRDTNPTSNAEALRIAKRELALRNAHAKAWEYVLKEHRDERGFHYTVNTMCHLRDEVQRPIVDTSAFITKRDVIRKERGDSVSQTTLTLVPKNSIVL